MSLQLCEISGIPLENLEFAKVCYKETGLNSHLFCVLLPVGKLMKAFMSRVVQGRGTFPCDISVLEIHQDLDWNPKVSTLNVWPLYICDDGAVVFYRYIYSVPHLNVFLMLKSKTFEA